MPIVADLAAGRTINLMMERYRQLIRGILAVGEPTFSPETEDETRLRVERVIERAWAHAAMRQGNFRDLLAVQQPSGALLPNDPLVNPEIRWYHELVLLQAVGTYGWITGDVHALEAADRAAEYHLRETQPDHATAEPWGLLAFIHNPNTHLLADQLLHNVQIQHPDGPRGVTRILLADTLLCLQDPPASLT